MSDLILYTSEDGESRLQLKVDGGTIWLSQAEIAELFQTTKHNISIHTKNIFQDGELTKEATVKDSLTVQTEGQACSWYEVKSFQSENQMPCESFLSDCSWESFS